MSLSIPDLDGIYTPQWKERIHKYFHSDAPTAHATRVYWSFNFNRQWIKHRRGVLQELDLVAMMGHWTTLAGRRVLVMGSWLGAEAIAYALAGATVTAIDLDSHAVGLSEELAARYGVPLRALVMDASRTSFADESFDLVSCSQVLEHVPAHRQPALIAEMWRLCAPGGRLWLDTPNLLHYKDKHDTGLPLVHWLPRPVKKRIARWLGRDIPPGELSFGAETVGLHYYISYFRLRKILGGLGPYEVLSKYHGFADVNHYARQRRRQGRAHGWLFPVKLALLRWSLRVWDFNWLSPIRVVIRKLPATSHRNQPAESAGLRGSSPQINHQG
jgi:2-polyprenyl-3-methyl-5-hydroxy-6-metoxy-1,4-benzoquinol methylase